MLDAGLHPSYRLIAKKTGLNLKTVEKHINDWKFDEFIKPYRYYSPLVLNCLVQKIREYGDAPRVKLFNQLVNGYRDSHEITGKDGEPLVTSVKIEVNNGTETKDD